ncbi:hypothetical protein [Saccharopolyspora indica]
MTITAKRLRDLEEAYEELAALEAHGVDNWSGYSEALICASGEECEICG